MADVYLLKVFSVPFTLSSWTDYLDYYGDDWVFCFKHVVVSRG